MINALHLIWILPAASIKPNMVAAVLGASK